MYIKIKNLLFICFFFTCFLFGQEKKDALRLMYDDKSPRNFEIEESKFSQDDKYALLNDSILILVPKKLILDYHYTTDKKSLFPPRQSREKDVIQKLIDSPIYDSILMASKETIEYTYYAKFNSEIKNNNIAVVDSNLVFETKDIILAKILKRFSHKSNIAIDSTSILNSHIFSYKIDDKKNWYYYTIGLDSKEYLYLKDNYKDLFKFKKTKSLYSYKNNYYFLGYDIFNNQFEKLNSLNINNFKLYASYVDNYFYDSYNNKVAISDFENKKEGIYKLDLESLDKLMIYDYDFSDNLNKSEIKKNFDYYESRYSEIFGESKIGIQLNDTELPLISKIFTDWEHILLDLSFVSEEFSMNRISVIRKTETKENIIYYNQFNDIDSLLKNENLENWKDYLRMSIEPRIYVVENKKNKERNVFLRIDSKLYQVYDANTLYDYEKTNRVDYKSGSSTTLKIIQLVYNNKYDNKTFTFFNTKSKLPVTDDNINKTVTYYHGKNWETFNDSISVHIIPDIKTKKVSIHFLKQDFDFTISSCEDFHKDIYPPCFKFIAKSKDKNSFEFNTNKPLDSEGHSVIGISNNQKYLFLRFFDDRTYVKVIKIVDLEKQKILNFDIQKERFESIYYSPSFYNNYEILLISNNENHYEILDLENEQKLADYYYYDEDNWYIITPEGYYDKSENSNKNLYWVYNDIEVYEIDNFKQYFHIQGLIDKILNGETYKTTSAKSLSETFTENLPPLIDAYLEKNTIHYNIDARNGTLPENIYLNINGKDRTIPIKSSENKKKTQGTIELVEFIDKLSPDTNEINQLHLRAYTKSIHNFFHKTQTFEYTLPQDVVKKYYKTNDTQPHIHMLFVGINEFKNKNFTLNYSEKDASKMNLFLDKATKKLFNNDRKNRVHSTLLTNENATKDKIFAELDAIKKNAKSNDVVLLFFSTHGLSLSTILNETNDQIAFENIKNGKLKDNYYLLTQNADLNENTFKDFLQEDQKLQTLISDNAISYVELMQYFTNNDWKPYKDILIVDACQSGKIVDLYNDKNKNVINDDDKRKKLLRGFNSISGTYTITASSANQVAKENAELGHSVLTYGLLSSLTYAEKKNEENVNYLQLENWFETAKENIKTTNSQIPITHYGGNSKLPIAEVDNDIAQEIRKYLNDKKKLIKFDFDNGKETYQEDNEQIAQLLKEELRKFEKNETTNFKIIKEDSNLDSYFLKFTYDILKKDEKAQLICNLYYYEKVANSNRKRKNIYDDKTFEVDIENKETLLIQIKNTITQINNQLINKEI